MPPIVATSLSLLLTLYLIVSDRKRNPPTSLALWLPCLWLSILGSRSVNQWINGQNIGAANALMDGSPIDRNVYTALMAIGLVVLLKRRLRWLEIFRQHGWLTAFFLYCGISILWSDFPEVAFKRWIKAFGDPIMVLIVLTEPHPVKAVETVLKRCAYFLLPMSIVFIKYYGDLGRGYDPWTGGASYMGVTTSKNMLGYLLFVFGLFFSSTLIGRFGRSKTGTSRRDVLTALLFLWMIGWLFYTTDSKTPLVCLALGLLILVGSSFDRARRYWGSLVLVGLLIFCVLQITMDVSAALIESTGRDATLTGRTDLWLSVIEVSENPWFGAGFSSFWLGKRLETLWAQWPFQPVQAHNGYLETYLNLGWLGVGCLAGVIVSGYRKLRREWMRSPEPGNLDTAERDFARFGMACLTGLIVYNVTEATFLALNFMFIVFLMVVMNSPARRVQEPIGKVPSQTSSPQRVRAPSPRDRRWADRARPKPSRVRSG
jgi:exopolysaccharide production protein ExoQ